MRRQFRGSPQDRRTTRHTVRDQTPARPSVGPMVGTVVHAVAWCGMAGAVATVLLWEQPDTSGGELVRLMGLGAAAGERYRARLIALVVRDRQHCESRGRLAGFDRGARRRAERSERKPAAASGSWPTRLCRRSCPTAGLGQAARLPPSFYWWRATVLRARRRGPATRSGRRYSP